MKLATFFLFLALVGCTDLGQTPEWQQTQDIVLANPTSFRIDDWPRGDYIIESSTLHGDLLKLKISVSGSEPKSIQLVAWNYFLESSPVQAEAILSFTPRPSMNTRTTCDVTFDLSPLKREWQRMYRRSSGVMMFGIRYRELPPRLAVRYTF